MVKLRIGNAATAGKGKGGGEGGPFILQNIDRG